MASKSTTSHPRPGPWLAERLLTALMVGGLLLLPIAIWWPL